MTDKPKKELCDVQNDAHAFYHGNNKNSPVGSPVPPEHRKEWHDNHDALHREEEARRESR